MRILLWSETFYPRIGGVEVMGTAFVRALHARGHDVMILAGPYEELDHEPQDFYGMPLYRFPFEYSTRPYSMEMVVRIKKRLETLLTSFQPEIFHLYQSRLGFFFHSTAKATGVPSLLTIHGAFFDSTPEINQARRHFCQQVDWVTACSHFTINETRRVVPEIIARSSAIHNALTMPDLAPTPLDFDAPRVLYVGRLHPQKRVDIALEAFAQIHAHFPTARLLVAGQGSEEAALHAHAAQLGIQPYVDFLGWVAPQDVPALINQATVMLVPSRLEPFGLVALQGGQVARPVIAARVGGLPEVIRDGETGVLVEALNATAMAEALAALLRDPDRARALGVAARQHVQQHFGWEPFLDAYEALYAHLHARAKAHA